MIIKFGLVARKALVRGPKSSNQRDKQFPGCPRTRSAGLHRTGPSRDRQQLRDRAKLVGGDGHRTQRRQRTLQKMSAGKRFFHFSHKFSPFRFFVKTPSNN